MEWLAELGGLGQLTAGIILAVVVLSVFSGKLIPEKTHDRIVRAKDDQIDTLHQVRDEYATNIGTVLEQNETVYKIVSTLAANESQPPPGGTT